MIMDMPKVRDKQAAIAFLNSIVGWEAVGVAGDEEIARARSAEARAHLEAVLGEDMPNYGFELNNNSKKAAAIATYLRSVADAISPAHAGEG